MSSSKITKNIDNSLNPSLEGTKLHTSFTLWFNMTNENQYSNNQNYNSTNTNNTIVSNSKSSTKNESEYSELVKKLCEFGTLEDFWEIYQFIKKPENCKQGLEISIFKSNIKPLWEDEANKQGGKVSLKIKKEYSNVIWDEFVYRLIGNNFPVINNDEINGILSSIKRDSNFIQIWFKNYNSSTLNDISLSIRQILNIPDNVELDIRPFNKEKDFNSHNNNNYISSNNSNNNRNNNYYDYNSSNYNNKQGYRKN